MLSSSPIRRSLLIGFHENRDNRSGDNASPNIVDRATNSDLSGGDGTRPADERTYLAWLRSGLSAFAVSLGAGKIVPALAVNHDANSERARALRDRTELPLVALVYLRHRAVAAIGHGDDVAIDDQRTAALVAVVVVLSLALTVVVGAT